MVRRITKDGLLLTILIISSFLAIPFGDNIKVSLQSLILFLIFLSTPKLIDKVIITISYLFISIFININGGITPTFGFIIGFILSSFVFHFAYKIKINNEIIKVIISCVLALLIIYITGVIFIMIYLNTSFIQALLIGVVPYIIFDIAKIGLIIILIASNKNILKFLRK